MISGSFQGPLSDLRHPPSFEHEQSPPRKSGSCLFKEKKKFQFHKMKKSTRRLKKNVRHKSILERFTDLESMTSNNLFWNLFPKTYTTSKESTLVIHALLKAQKK